MAKNNYGVETNYGQVNIDNAGALTGSSELVDCPRCNGRGWIPVREGGRSLRSVIADMFNGSDGMRMSDCPGCAGRGKIRL